MLCGNKCGTPRFHQTCQGRLLVENLGAPEKGGWSRPGRPGPEPSDIQHLDVGREQGRVRFNLFAFGPFSSEAAWKPRRSMYESSSRRSDSDSAAPA